MRKRLVLFKLFSRGLGSEDIQFGSVEEPLAGCGGNNDHTIVVPSVVVPIPPFSIGVQKATSRHEEGKEEAHNEKSTQSLSAEIHWVENKVSTFFSPSEIRTIG